MAAFVKAGSREGVAKGSFRDLPGPGWVVVLSTMALTVIMGVLAYPHWTPVPLWQVVLAGLVCSGLSYAQYVVAPGHGMNLCFAGLLAVVMLWGPANGAAVAFIEGVASNLLPNLPLFRAK